VKSRGLFVVFEGIDGCGKSTQARRVARARDALLVFEPGGTPVGADLRRWILDVATPMAPSTVALMLLADRSHHVRTVIEPALDAGRAVVCDRYFASTLAYQGYGGGVDLAQLRAATDLAIGECRPDLTVLIDLDPVTANGRREPDRRDRFESLHPQFHDRVRQGYLELAAQDPAAWYVVDGTPDEATVAAVIDERLAALAWASD